MTNLEVKNMQYIDNTTSDDLKSGFSSYVLQGNTTEIVFSAYNGDTAFGADKKGQNLNAYHRGYFLRKGFSDAIYTSDPNILVPIYKDDENNDVYPESKSEAVRLIYAGKLNISGFRFVENATNEQKEEAFAKVINCFVSASTNLDFSSEKNLFFISGNYSRISYNNGGNPAIKIRGVDIQEKLGLKTQDVKREQNIRRIIAQRKIKKI